MALFDSLLSPITSILDKIIPDPKIRDAAKLELLKLQGTQELEMLRVQFSAIIAEAQSTDPWTSRARPTFSMSCMPCYYGRFLWGLSPQLRPIWPMQ